MPTNSRRDLLKKSATVLSAATIASSIGPGAFAAESNTIDVVLIGCGGRGTGAAQQALSTSGPTRLVAMADVFPDRLKGSLDSIKKRHGAKVEVPPERQFIGFDGFKKAIDFLGKDGVAICTTPPAFRPIHVEYAVNKGKHVFMEKSFGVDAPGVNRIRRAGKAADEKNLKIAGGLMSRHYQPLVECVEQIHKGIIGDVVTSWPYRMHGAVGFRPKKADETELQHQIRNYSNFTWVNGSFLLDWLIHNLDVCCWVKNGWPVQAQASGGRQMRVENDQLFDHYSVEYTFEDGSRMLAQGRHMNRVWGFFGSHVFGTKGSAILGEGVTKPRIYKGWQTWSPKKEDMIWEYTGRHPGENHYQYEHDLLFDAIRNNKPWNEADRCCNASMVGILGRMAVESGQMVTWKQANESTLELAPNLDQLTYESAAPVMPGPDGKYPVARPGETKAF